MNALQKVVQGDIIARITEIQDNYTYQVRSWVNWMTANNQQPDEIGIQKYFEWLNTESGYQPRTISVKRSAVKKRVRQIFKNESRDFKANLEAYLKELDSEYKTSSPKENDTSIKREKTLNGSQYIQLLNACRSERQKLFIEFLYSTGCRVSEMVNIKLSDIKIDHNTAYIRVKGKGKKYRTIRIQDDLFNRIAAEFFGNEFLFETSTGNSYNRCYVSNQITKIGKRINKRISAHTLRHSFATRKVEQLPGKIDAISKYMGHSSVSITLDLYVHTELSDNELFEEAI